MTASIALEPVVSASAEITSARRAAPGRIPELDGLRGMAILLVLLFHFVSEGPRGATGSLLFRIQSSVGLGWTGVDLFFVLSGFLIGGIVLDARTSPRYFKTFYARRFFRIIPLYYTWIGIYFLVSLTTLHGPLDPFVPAQEKWGALPTYMLFLQNWTRNLHSTFGTAWLGHLWSLAVEEQFYLLIPVAVRFLSPRRLVLLLCFTVLSAPICRLVVFKYLSHAHAMQYILTPCRADALAMGVLLAVFWRDDRSKTWLSRNRWLLYATIPLLLIAVLYLAISDPSPYSLEMTVWGFSSIDTFFACLIAAALRMPGGLWASVCRWTFVRGFGEVSYCTYIVHQVVNALYHAFLLHATPSIVTWQGATVTVLAVLSSFVVARLSWTFFENPLLRRGHAYKY